MKTFAMALKLVWSYSATIVLAYELLVMIEETGRDKRITPKKDLYSWKSFGK